MGRVLCRYCEQYGNVDDVACSGVYSKTKARVVRRLRALTYLCRIKSFLVVIVDLRGVGAWIIRTQVYQSKGNSPRLVHRNYCLKHTSSTKGMPRD